jgi:hypothetical protein
VRRGSEHRPKLAAEHGEVLEAVANASTAEGGVALGDVGLLLRLLVGPEVEGADGEGASLEALDAVDVRRVLLLLAGFVGLGEVEELRAEEADAGPAVGEDEVDLLGELDVAEQFDLNAVGGLRGSARRG